jgi:phosphonopyruvate decarboxylase
MMRRDACLEALAAVRGDAIVVATYTTAFEWERISPSPLNLPATGAMGQGSSHGLGLALGLPAQKVIVLDGDGSLLMNLGTLVTIAAARPANLVHFVCENGTYEANGSHPIPGAGVVDFAGFARAAGYPHVFAFDDAVAFARALPDLLALTGPVFATLKFVPGDPVAYDYRWMHGKTTRERFAAAVRELTAC